MYAFGGFDPLAYALVVSAVLSSEAAVGVWFGLAQHPHEVNTS
jgi:hypothetical protein